ncbi:MAG: DUF975 family protein [Bacillota bacterium]
MYLYDRVALKGAARRDLKPFYWKTVLVCLIQLAILQLVDIGSLLANSNDPMYYISNQYLAISWVGSILTLVVSGPLAYGLYHLFTDILRTQDMKISTMFVGFKRFGSTFLLGLLQSVFTLLWCMLLIVPGFIKAVAYSMAFFIQRDNPEMSANECLQASIRLTKGHKGKIFMLQLSFVGWYLLASLPFIFIDIPYIYITLIGFVFISPYMTMSMARMYDFLILNYNEANGNQETTSETSQAESLQNYTTASETATTTATETETASEAETKEKENPFDI